MLVSGVSFCETMTSVRRLDFMLLQMGRLERTSSSFCLSKGTIFSLTTTLSSSKSSMMKSWLSLSMFTMMDLMEGSHSIRTPGVCENGTGQLRCSSAGKR